MCRKYHKILIIDDDQFQLNFIRKLLEEKGYEVLASFDPLEGIQLAVDTQPDIIMTDYNMPKVSGLEVCQKIRSHETLKNTKLILLTASSCPENDKSACEKLVNGWINKRIGPKGILNCLAQLAQTDSSDTCCGE